MSSVQGVFGGSVPVVNAVDTGETAAAAECGAPSPLLPDPALALTMTGDPGAMVAALAVETGQSEKDVSRKINQTEANVQYTQEQAEVSDMRNKAQDLLTQGIAEGGIDAGSAALSIAGAASPTTTTTTTTTTPTTTGTQATAVTTTTGHGPLLGAIGKGVGAGSDALKGVFNSANENADANITQHDANAKAAGTAASAAYDSMRDGQKLLDAATDFFKEYSAAEQQAKAAALFRG
jgi:hypothetical protein